MAQEKEQMQESSSNYDASIFEDEGDTSSDDLDDSEKEMELDDEAAAMARRNNLLGAGGPQGGAVEIRI